MNAATKPKLKVVFKSFSMSVGDEAPDRPSVVITGRVAFDKPDGDYVSKWDITISPMGQNFGITNNPLYPNVGATRNEILAAVEDRICSSELYSVFMRSYIVERLHSLVTSVGG